MMETFKMTAEITHSHCPKNLCLLIQQTLYLVEMRLYGGKRFSHLLGQREREFLQERHGQNWVHQQFHFSKDMFRVPWEQVVSSTQGNGNQEDCLTLNLRGKN